MASADTLLSQWSELWRFPALSRLLKGECPPEGWSAWDLCRALLEGEEEATRAGAERIYQSALNEWRFGDARNFLESPSFCELLERPVERVAEEINQREAEERRKIEERLRRLRQIARNLTISLLDFNRHAVAVESAVAAGQFQLAFSELDRTEMALTECLNREEEILVLNATKVNDDTLRLIRAALADSRPGLARVMAERPQFLASQPAMRLPLVRELRRGETWLQMIRGLLGFESLPPNTARRWSADVSDENAYALLTLLLRVHENGVTGMDEEFVSRLIAAIGACFGRQSMDDNAALLRVHAVDGGFLCTTAAPDWLRLAPFLRNAEGLTIFLPLRDVRPDDLTAADICVDVFGGCLPRGTQGVAFLGIGDFLACLGTEERDRELARVLALQVDPRELLAEDAPAQRGALGRATRLLAAELDAIDPWGRLGEEEMRDVARRFLARLGIDVLGYDFELMLYLASHRPIIFYRLLHHAIHRSFFRASRQVSGHSVFRHTWAKNVLADGVATALEEVRIDLDTAKALVDQLDEHALGEIDEANKWFSAEKFESLLSEYGYNPSETTSLLVRAGLIDEGGGGYRASENGIVEWIRSQ